MELETSPFLRTLPSFSPFSHHSFDKSLILVSFVGTLDVGYGSNPNNAQIKLRNRVFDQNRGCLFKYFKKPIMHLF